MAAMKRPRMAANAEPATGPVGGPVAHAAAEALKGRVDHAFIRELRATLAANANS